jgi:hypothetical protein
LRFAHPSLKAVVSSASTIRPGTGVASHPRSEPMKLILSRKGAKGHEFVLDLADYPGVQRWTQELLERPQEV